MIRYENHCVGCPPDIGCIGSACCYRHVPVPFCDKCGDEIDGDAYEGDDMMLCEDCFLKLFKTLPEEHTDVCSKCGDDCDVIYIDGDDLLCEYCLLERYKISEDDLESWPGY